MGIDQKQIRQLLGKDNPTVLEIGAHKGEDTLKFLREFPAIRIYSFEPDPRCIVEFKRAVVDDRSTLIEAAVSDNDGETILHMSTSWPVKIPRLFSALGAKWLWTRVVLTETDWSSLVREKTASTLKRSGLRSKAAMS